MPATSGSAHVSRSAEPPVMQKLISWNGCGAQRSPCLILPALTWLHGDLKPTNTGDQRRPQIRWAGRHRARVRTHGCRPTPSGQALGDRSRYTPALSRRPYAGHRRLRPPCGSGTPPHPRSIAKHARGSHARWRGHRRGRRRAAAPAAHRPARLDPGWSLASRRRRRASRTGWSGNHAATVDDSHEPRSAGSRIHGRG